MKRMLLREKFQEGARRALAFTILSGCLTAILAPVAIALYVVAHFVVKFW